MHWNQTAHEAGFVTRQVDKGTGWDSLRASATQNLAISTIGYPFVESDMIGGSGGQPAPSKDVLVRWAQAASLMPLMYASTSPVDTNDTTTGQKVDYDQETVDLYRRAIETHEKLAPYIWDQVRSTLKTGDPIMRPLFFDFPKDEASYTVTDEWMLGPAVLAAPKLSTGATRAVHLPPGTWYDVNQGTVIRGPKTLKGYAAPLGVTPAFVNLKAKGAAKAIRALKRDDAPGRLRPDRPGRPGHRRRYAVRGDHRGDQLEHRDPRGTPRRRWTCPTAGAPRRPARPPRSPSGTAPHSPPPGR